MLASHSHRFPQKFLNIAHKKEYGAASKFSSLVQWNSKGFINNNDNQEKERLNKGRESQLVFVRTNPSHLSSQRPALFQRCNRIYRMYGTYHERHWSFHRDTFHNPQKYLFSTAATPPSNNDSSLKSESDEETKSTRRDKARKLARTGATSARKGGSKVRELLSKYGWYFGGTYFGIYVVSLSTFYTALETGLLDPSVITSFWGGDLMGHGEEEVDSVKMVANMLEKWDFTRPYSESIEQNPKITQLGISWLATKIIEPARIAVAVYVTPKIAKALKGKNVEVKEQEGEKHQGK